MSDVILNLADGEMNHTRQELQNYRNPFSDIPPVGCRIGSETCSRLLSFVREEELVRQIREIRSADMEAWFVFPNVAESDWDKAVCLLSACVREGISGIVVNDYGLLSAAAESGCRIVLGRMFDKRMRDIRSSTPWQQNAVLEETSLLTEEYQKLLEREKVFAVEMEAFGCIDSLSIAPAIWLHAPYILLSNGRYCEFSGIGREQDGRYQLNRCSRQCRNIQGKGFHDSMEGYLYHRQNAFYMQGKKAYIEKVLEGNRNVTILFRPDSERKGRNEE